MLPALILPALIIIAYTGTSFAGEGWGYTGKHGVHDWSQDFPVCGGNRQSPINIDTFHGLSYESNHQNDVSYENYDRVPIAYVIQNNGHTVVMSPTTKKTKVQITVGRNKKTYKFLQLHFHWGSNNKIGSEHKINGRTFPLEMHLVHANIEYTAPAEKKDGLAVLGVLFKIGRHNKAMEPIIKSLQSLKYLNNQTLVEPFALDAIIPKDRSIHRYLGSLTTPPCSESVIWSVFQNYIEVSAIQMKYFRTLIDAHGKKMVNNFRPTQPLHGRRVFDFSAGDRKEGYSKLLLISYLLFTYIYIGF